jgi:hypothetical protein
MRLDIVSEHIKYLKEKTKYIKGLKINYHESAVSQIEAVLTRGDAKLCDYIYALYKKGCYLDAWGEYFKENVWYDTAKELGFSLENLAQKEYAREEILPWDFIDTGLDKNWLINEYNLAFSPENMPNAEEQNTCHIVPTCQDRCVNCGVCANLKTKKVMAKPYKSKLEYTPKIHRNPEDGSQSDLIPSYRYRIKLTKTGILRYFSHLDWQNTFMKVLSRSGLPIAYSRGYNPVMKVSLGVALPLFAESLCELVDIELLENYDSSEEEKSSEN